MPRDGSDHTQNPRVNIEDGQVSFWWKIPSLKAFTHGSPGYFTCNFGTFVAACLEEYSLHYNTGSDQTKPERATLTFFVPDDACGLEYRVLTTRADFVGTALLNGHPIASYPYGFEAPSGITSGVAHLGSNTSSTPAQSRSYFKAGWNTIEIVPTSSGSNYGDAFENHTWKWKDPSDHSKGKEILVHGYTASTVIYVNLIRNYCSEGACLPCTCLYTYGYRPSTSGGEPRPGILDLSLIPPGQEEVYLSMAEVYNLEEEVASSYPATCSVYNEREAPQALLFYRIHNDSQLSAFSWGSLVLLLLFSLHFYWLSGPYYLLPKNNSYVTANDQ